MTVTNEQVEAAALVIAGNVTPAQMAANPEEAKFARETALAALTAAAALEAVSSIHEAEPVAWQPRYTQEVIDHHRDQDPRVWEYAMTVYQTEAEARGYGYGRHEVRPLYAHPAPISKGVTVKALKAWINFYALACEFGRDINHYADAVAEVLDHDEAIRAALSHTVGEP